MKTIIKTSIIIIFTFFIVNDVNAQKQKSSKIDTTTFEVKGVCGMCKERIENAALVKGVKWVDWNKATDTLTVICRKDKTNILDVHKSIAEAGHTTDKVKCNMDAYNKLPACCAYMGNVKKH